MRNILFITSDQQRFDSLGCNGGAIASTPVADKLAATGINYGRCHTQNVVCMPSRSTMFNGQYPRTHGVTGNGIALPEAHPNVARYLKQEAGYQTALIGKSHFEPGLDMGISWAQNRMAVEDRYGPWFGFDHCEFAMHSPVAMCHYSKWLQDQHPEHISGFAAILTGEGGGDTGAPEVCYNPIPRDVYHTDWVAERTTAWLDTVDQQEPWFCWVSFPDPHHPWDPPEEAARRINWRDLDLPPGHPGSHQACMDVLAQKPQHWLDWYMGRFANPEGGPSRFVPHKMSHDQVREITALVHVQNELIDEACGNIVDHLQKLGVDGNTDIFFTTDHGELQGDYGLMFKGPYHVDALMRLPMIWRPAPEANITPAVVTEPVGLMDLAPTFCEIAQVPVPKWMEGRPLPTTTGSDRERVLTTWDSQFKKVGMHISTIYRDGYTLSMYHRSTTDEGGHFPVLEFLWGDKGRVPQYSGAEGELYNHAEDPLQWRNLWADPDAQAIKGDLVSDLKDHLPAYRKPALKVSAPT